DRADLAIDQQRKCHDADDQYRHCKQETDEVADYNQHPALGCGEDLPDEMRHRGGWLIAEIRDVDGLRHRNPDREDNQQQETESGNGIARWRMQYVEGVLPGNIVTLLAPPA